MKCHAYLIAKSIDLSSINATKKLREVSFISQGENVYFIFPYGVLVCWGDGELAPIKDVIKSSLEKPYSEDQILSDSFDVEKVKSDKLVLEDTIYLEDDDDYLKLALSHPIAQALRLNLLENMIIENTQKIIHIPQNLARNGGVKESKKEISKLQGELYLSKSKIILEHSILDKPEFFWEYPEYDSYYNRLAEYLEIAPRIEILNKKLGTIDEILSILSDELNHRHSSKLEIIIILLIFIELIIFFLKDIFKLF